MSAALDRTERGTITLDSNGHVRDISDRARQWLDEYWGPRRNDSTMLPDPLRRWLAEQQRKTGATNGDVPEPRKPLIIERTGRRLIVRCFSGSASRLVLLQEKRIRLSVTSLRSFGLSNRETEVLVWVAEGKSNAEIAQILGARPRTVGKHLEHVYLKLGVESRTAAARVAWTATGMSGPDA